MTAVGALLDGRVGKPCFCGITKLCIFKILRFLNFFNMRMLPNIYFWKFEGPKMFFSSLETIGITGVADFSP